MLLTRPAKDSYQLAAASTVVAYRNDITQSRVICFADLVKDLHEVVRCAPSGEDNNTAPRCSWSWSWSWSCGSGPIKGGVYGRGHRQLEVPIRAVGEIVTVRSHCARSEQESAIGRSLIYSLKMDTWNDGKVKDCGGMSSFRNRCRRPTVFTHADTRYCYVMIYIMREELCWSDPTLPLRLSRQRRVACPKHTSRRILARPLHLAIPYGIAL